MQECLKIPEDARQRYLKAQKSDVPAVKRAASGRLSEIIPRPPIPENPASKDYTVSSTPAVAHRSLKIESFFDKISLQEEECINSELIKVFFFDLLLY